MFPAELFSSRSIKTKKMGNSRNITKTKKKKNKPNSTNDVSEVIVISPTSSDSQSIEPNISNDNSIQTSYNVSPENEEEVEREKHVKKKKTGCTDENLLCKFPMNRINRIVRSEDDFRLTQEAVFLINKASEKFLDLFTEKAYESSVNKRKSYVAYQDLSVVSKQKRLEFLADFIPEKLKMEDAFEERKAAGAWRTV